MKVTGTELYPLSNSEDADRPSELELPLTAWLR